MPQRHKPTAPRWARLAIWGTVLALGMITSWGVLRPNPRMTPATLIGQSLNLPSTLQITTTAGTDFDLADFQGKPSLVMFGFTHCPDICPMTLGVIQALKDDLAHNGQDIALWLVTLDPERDTITDLQDYLSWAPQITGLRPEPKDLAQTLAGFQIWAQRVPQSDGSYSIDHSSAVLVLAPNGQVLGILNPLSPPEELAQKLKTLLASSRDS